jgi:hypothetical protein
MPTPPIHISWKQDGFADYNWIIPSEAVDALAQAAAAQTEQVPVDTVDPEGNHYQNWTTRPKYSGIGDLVIKRMIELVVMPILAQYPPATIATMEAEAKAAMEAVNAAKKLAAESFLTPAQ